MGLRRGSRYSVVVDVSPSMIIFRCKLLQKGRKWTLQNKHGPNWCIWRSSRSLPWGKLQINLLTLIIIKTHSVIQVFYWFIYFHSLHKLTLIVLGYILCSVLLICMCLYLCLFPPRQYLPLSSLFFVNVYIGFPMIWLSQDSHDFRHLFFISFN